MKRLYYLPIIVTIIVTGLWSRSDPAFPTWPGDLLWSTLVYLVLAFLFFRAQRQKILIATLLISVLVELSQLIDNPLLERIRSNSLGAVMIGYGFVWLDLVWYTIGAVLGWCIDKFLIKL